MDIFDVIKAIWKQKIMILIVVCVAVGGAWGVTKMIPSKYNAVAPLKVPTNLYASIPGFYNTTKSEKNDISIYEALIDNNSFKKAVTKGASSAGLKDLKWDKSSEITVNGDPSTGYIAIEVNAKKEDSARIIADVSSRVLIAKILNFMESDNERVGDSIRVELRNVRKELFRAEKDFDNFNAALKKKGLEKKPITDTDRFKVSELGARVSELKSQQSMCSDFLNRLRMDNVLQKTTVAVYEPTGVQVQLESQSLQRNTIFAGIIGLIFAIGLAVLLEEQSIGKRVKKS